MSSLRTPGFVSSPYSASVPPNQSWGSYTNQSHQGQTHGGHESRGIPAMGPFSSYGQHDVFDFNDQYGGSTTQVASASNRSINPTALASTQTPSGIFSPGNSSAFVGSSHLSLPISAPSSGIVPVMQGVAQRSNVSNDQLNRQWDENGWGEIVSHFVMGPLELFQDAMTTTRSPQSTSTGLSQEWGLVSAAPLLKHLTQLTLASYSSARRSTALPLEP
jgi:hypothetical protein